MANALPVTRAENFPEWYQAVCRDADMAEPSPTRGSMIIKPWGMGIWERLRDNLDARIKETGHDNYYFPLLIPMSFIAKEADHVEGFAKEMAVVTHHRLKAIDGVLGVDPDAKLEEPYIIRPTSETIIGDAMSRWVKSYRDLPLLTNQWANVMRWEMRTRLFLRTSEFLWQEGHTAHVDKADALEETMRMLEVYRTFAEDFLGIPVVAGEKPANERFPGADNTFSIEAMMQDGKALQAGTSHYLGTHFSAAQNIRYQDRDGGQTLAHTTSWGVTTRLIGALIMTHGDDDGMRAPPAVAPRQVVIVPMLRGKPEDAELLAYCEKLANAVKAQRVFDESIRVLIDRKDYKPSDKRWDWVRKGAPVICEIGPRDAANGVVSFLRRDALRGEGKVAIQSMPLEQFAGEIGPLLKSIQHAMKAEADSRLKSNIRDDIKSFDELADYFRADDEETTFRGWVRASWSKPEGAALEALSDKLKALKLTLRNAPLEQPATLKPCLFTGAAGAEEILIARAY